MKDEKVYLEICHAIEDAIGEASEELSGADLVEAVVSSITNGLDNMCDDAPKEERKIRDRLLGEL